MGAKVDHGAECTITHVPYERYILRSGVQYRFVIWDLPGCGTNNFPVETYLRDMGIRYFNYIILMTAERPFASAEIKLMNEMQEHKVPFAMVRGKIDQTKLSCDEEGDDFE